jgi:hypothetical protein
MVAGEKHSSLFDAIVSGELRKFYKTLKGEKKSFAAACHDVDQGREPLLKGKEG